MSCIGLINYGAGNVNSVRNALQYLGIKSIDIDSSSQMDSVDRFILPGVGAFTTAMYKLETLDILNALNYQIIEKGKLFLGICVGMQILCDEGHEFEICQGLGFIRGVVDKIETNEFDLPIPHIGWNELTLQQPCPLFDQMSQKPCFYFLHSYQFIPNEKEAVAATCNYGTKIASCIHKNNIFGVQFHPEKSQRDGLRLLMNFSNL